MEIAVLEWITKEYEFIEIWIAIYRIPIIIEKVKNSDLFAIIATLISIISLIITIYFNNKAFKQTQENLKTQLQYEDRKRALTNLQTIMNDTKHGEFLIEKIDTFINSIEWNYVPLNIQDNVKDKRDKLDKFMIENEIPPRSEEPVQDNKPQNEYDDYQLKLKIEVESFKNSVKREISDNLKF